MLRALDLDTEEHPLSASYKRNKFVVSIRRENRSKMFTTLRKMQDTQEEEEGCGRDEEEGTDCVLAKEYKEDVVRFKKKEVKQEDFEMLEKMMDSEQPLEILEGIIGIRKLVDIHNFPIDQYVKSQTIDRLFTFLEDSHIQVKYEATCVFSSIASIYTPLNKYIASYKCIPTFIGLLKLNHQFSYQVMWFFSNMLVDSTIFRNQLINQGMAKILIDLLEKTKDKKVEKVVAQTMANMCRGDPLPQYDKVKELMVALCFVLAQGRIQDSQYFSECLWGISYHVNVRKAEISKIIESNISIKCIQILNTEEYHQQEDNLILPCSRVISRLSEGGVKIIQYLLDNNVLEALEKMLYHVSVVIRRQACLSLSNIAASNFQHINLLLQNNDLINRLKQMMERDEIHVKYQIAAFFCNMCNQKELDLDVLIIQLEIVEYFKDLLTSQHEQKIVAFMDMLDLPLRLSQQKVSDGGQQSLLALEMHRKGVLSILQQLQYHENQAIYDATSKLLFKYFRSFMDDPLTYGPFVQQEPQTLKSL